MYGNAIVLCYGRNSIGQDLFQEIDVLLLSSTLIDSAKRISLSRMKVVDGLGNVPTSSLGQTEIHVQVTGSPN